MEKRKLNPPCLSFGATSCELIDKSQSEAFVK